MSPGEESKYTYLQSCHVMPPDPITHTRTTQTHTHPLHVFLRGLSNECPTANIPPARSLFPVSSAAKQKQHFISSDATRVNSLRVGTELEREREIE